MRQGENRPTTRPQTKIDKLTAQVEHCNRLADEAAHLLADHIEALTRRLQERDGDAQQSA